MLAREREHRAHKEAENAAARANQATEDREQAERIFAHLLARIAAPEEFALDTTDRFRKALVYARAHGTSLEELLGEEVPSRSRSRQILEAMRLIGKPVHYKDLVAYVYPDEVGERAAEKRISNVLSALKEKDLVIAVGNGQYVLPIYLAPTPEKRTKKLVLDTLHALGEDALWNLILAAESFDWDKNNKIKIGYPRGSKILETFPSRDYSRLLRILKEKFGVTNVEVETGGTTINNKIVTHRDGLVGGIDDE